MPLLNALHAFARNFSLDRCSVHNAAVLCMMFVLLHYCTMSSDQQVSLIGGLRFMARDHKENLIFLLFLFIYFLLSVTWWELKDEG